MADEDGKQADVGADIENTPGFGKRDAVFKVDLVFEDLAVKKIGFTVVAALDGQTAGEFIAIVWFQLSGLLQMQNTGKGVERAIRHDVRG